jgi:hypothetical protein
MRRLIAIITVAAALVALPAAAQARTRTCHMYSAPIVNIHERGTSCAVARTLATAEYWNTTHWVHLYFGGPWWHVTWWTKHYRYVDALEYRATFRGAVVTFEIGP